MRWPIVSIHAVAGDHLEGDLGRPLQVVGRAGRDVAGEHQALRGASAHQHGDAVLEIAVGEQEAILGRPLDRIAERADAARNDRDLVDRIDARQARRDQGVPHLVIGDAAALLRVEHAALLFQAGDDALDRGGEVVERDARRRCGASR